MSALPTFSDFMLATNERVVTDPSRILNDAVENTYFIAEMIRGREAGDLLDGGSTITDRIMLSDNGSFEHYSPNAEFSPTHRDTLKKISLPWRFAKADANWTDEEIELNEGDPRVVFKKLKKSYMQAAMTSQWNGMEAALWAVPDTDTMEDVNADPGVPYSFPAFITEDTTNFHAAGFTNVATVDPASNAKWRNQVSTYDQNAPDDVDNGLFAAFDDMWLKTKFESPDTASDYFENDTLRKQKIVTDRNGMKLYVRLLRANNDRLVLASDAGKGYTTPSYNGVPLRYASALDSAAVYWDGSTGLEAAAATEPRFFWLNLMFARPKFHRRRYMKPVGPIAGGAKQPFSHVMYWNTYWQLWMDSRFRQGIVGPTH